LPGFADQQGLTRLVLIAHGDPARKERERNLRISVAEPKDPTEVASIIQAWLGGGGKKVDRISLHVCWGAGRQYASKDDGSRGAKMHRGIMPRDSFAWALAKYCGELAGTITARNVALGVAQDGKRVGTYFTQTVRGFPARNYHNVEPFEKYVFTPDPVGTLDAPKDPKFEPAGPAPD
ncbi:MAG: hypothetical protein HKN73_20685, partial [Gemmatimonadetes bacterium]|nr:hypothetical protein [Gemmatimonadota bacterium]